MVEPSTSRQKGAGIDAKICCFNVEHSGYLGFEHGLLPERRTYEVTEPTFVSYCIGTWSFIAF